MESEKCKTVLNYGLVEHYFIFTSIIFAFIFNHILTGAAFIVFNFRKSDPSWIHMLLIFIFIIFAIQCWWGTLRTKNIISSKLSKIVMLIIQPVLLFFLSYSLLPFGNSDMNYSKYFSETYPIIYAIAAANFIYLYYLNKHTITTVNYKKENKIRAITAASFSIIAIMGSLNVYGCFDLSSILNIALPFHVIVCFILIFYFISKYRNTISDFEYLDPDKFLKRIMPCAYHALRRKEIISFIVIKLKKSDEILFDKIKKITRKHDDKCIYCNYIFIFIPLPEENYEDILRNKANEIIEYIGCKKNVAYSWFDKKDSDYKPENNSKVKFDTVRFEQDVENFFNGLYNGAGNSKCFSPKNAN